MSAFKPASNIVIKLALLSLIGLSGGCFYNVKTSETDCFAQGCQWNKGDCVCLDKILGVRKTQGAIMAPPPKPNH